MVKPAINSGASSQSHLILMAMPAEVRSKILEQLLLKPEEKGLITLDHTRCLRRKWSPSTCKDLIAERLAKTDPVAFVATSPRSGQLLAVCRQLYEEGVYMLYNHQTFFHPSACWENCLTQPHLASFYARVQHINVSICDVVPERTALDSFINLRTVTVREVLQTRTASKELDHANLAF